jgi:hypothetical protein
MDRLLSVPLGEACVAAVTYQRHCAALARIEGNLFA